MPGPNIGYATLSVIPSMRGVEKELGAQMTAPAAVAGAKAGKLAGSGISRGLVGVGVGVAAIGVSLFKVGEKFDEAFDHIRVGTGATGKRLEGLKGDFRSVIATVPTDFGHAAEAIAQVNERLGLTGKPLQRVSEQFLELSRLQGGDVTQNIHTVTAAMNSWGISAVQQGPKLDVLFRVSQKTGSSVADLASTLAQGGPIFRQVGLTFEDSASLLGLFDKNGVNAGRAMLALSRVVALAAKEGKPAKKVLADTFLAIKNAPSDTKAAGVAVKVFGTRAGPQLAGLIRQGKLAYADLAKTIGKGGDTILGAAKDTNDFAEKWQVFKNQILLKIEPIASRVFSGVSKAMDFLSTPTGKVIGGVIGIVGAFLALNKAFKVLNAGLQAFKLATAANPFTLWLAGAAIAIFLIIKFRKQILGALKVVAGAFETAGKAVGRFFAPLVHFVASAGRAIVGFFEDLPGRVVGFVKDFFPLIIGLIFPPAGIALALVRFWGPISRFFISLPARILGLLTDAGRWLIDVGPKILTGLVNGLITGVAAVLTFFIELPVKILSFLARADVWLFKVGIQILTGLLKGLISFEITLGRFWLALPGRTLRFFVRAGVWLYNTGKDILLGLLQGIHAVEVKLWDFFRALPGVIGRFFRGAITWLYDKGKDIFKGAWQGVTVVAASLWNWFRDLPGKIRAFFRGAVTWLYNAGKQIIQGLINGITNAATGGGLFNSLKNVEKLILQWKGPPAHDIRLLQPAGAAIMRGLLIGLRSEENRLVSYLRATTGTIGGLGPSQLAVPSGRLATADPSATGVTSVTQHFNINNPAPEPASTSLYVVMRRLKLKASRS